MNSLIQNYINGNLTDAKRQAKRYSLAAIATALESAGFKPYSAATCAMYLKGKASFQAACDAEARKE